MATTVILSRSGWCDPEPYGWSGAFDGTTAGFSLATHSVVAAFSGTDPLIYDSTQDIYEGVIPHGGRWLGWLRQRNSYYLHRDDD